MMPSLGFSEILVLAVLALVVVGPKDLPLMLRKLGRFMAKLRAMANEFRSGFDELARQAELDELKREVEALRRANPLREIEREVTRAVPTARDLEPLTDDPAAPPPVAEPKPQASGDAPAADVAQDASPTEAKPAPAPAAHGGGA